MYYPGYNSGNVVFSEGNWFPFRVHNCVQLQDGEYYYVLQDINGLKHFLPAEFYENYGFTIGDAILCRIDRINCTGRIYLEPKHPHYSEGEIYHFEVINSTNSGLNNFLVVKDISGNSIEVHLCGNEKIETNDKNLVQCFVKSIRKYPFKFFGCQFNRIIII